MANVGSESLKAFTAVHINHALATLATPAILATSALKYSTHRVLCIIVAYFLLCSLLGMPPHSL